MREAIRHLVSITTNGNADPGSVTVVIFAMICQTAVIIASLFIIYRLWCFFFEVLSNLSAPKAKALAQLIGGFSADGALTGTGRAKIMGAGLSGTILILAFSCLATYFIGHHSINGTGEHAQRPAGYELQRATDK